MNCEVSLEKMIRIVQNDMISYCWETWAGREEFAEKHYGDKIRICCEFARRILPEGNEFRAEYDPDNDMPTGVIVFGEIHRFGLAQEHQKFLEAHPEKKAEYERQEAARNAEVEAVLEEYRQDFIKKHGVDPDTLPFEKMIQLGNAGLFQKAEDDE